jgi:hypothetical protein
MYQTITVPSGVVCVEWREGFGVVRTFQSPLAPIDTETGQPLSRWGWACVVVPRETALEILAMHEMPMWPSFAELQQAMSSMGFQSFVWEHWHGSRKRPCSLVLPSASLPVVSYPKATGATTHPTEMTALSATNNKHKTQSNIMTVTITITATDDSGKKEVEVSGQIFNLDGKEASATIVDALSAVTSAIGSFDAQTGAPV